VLEADVMMLGISRNVSAIRISDGLICAVRTIAGM
jgi:hypothetical protein